MGSRKRGGTRSGPAPRGESTDESTAGDVSGAHLDSEASRAAGGSEETRKGDDGASNPVEDTAGGPERPDAAAGAQPRAALWTRVATAGAVVACGLIVAWIVAAPLRMAGAESYARDEVRDEVAKELGREAGERRASDDAVAAWVAKNPDEFAERTAKLAEDVREGSSLPHAGGRVVYPGGYDAFLWMRHARNLTEKGTTCDAVVNGVCWDTMTLAPVGSEMVYARSVHIVAMAGLHIVLEKLFGSPLEFSAALLCAIVAALGVIPAFFLGRRIAGPVGGVVGALFAVGNAPAVSRMAAPDNDVWNVVLPLTMSSLLVAGLLDERPRWRWGFVVGAGGVAAVQLASWRGGIFSHAVLLCTLGALTLLAVARALKEKRWHLWREHSVTMPLALLVAYVGVSSLVLASFGGGDVYSEIWGRVRGVLGWSGGGGGIPGFTSALSTVSELVSFPWPRTIDRIGQTWFVVAAVSGMTWMFLPRGAWQRGNLIPVIVAGASTSVLWLLDDPNRGKILALVFLPGAIVASRMALTKSVPIGTLAAPVLVLVWGWMGTYQMLGTNRFELLATPMLGLSALAAVDRVAGWVRAALSEQLGRRGSLAAYALAFSGLTWAISRPVTYAHEVASNQLPRLTDAWYDAFIHIRDNSSEDAIINLWWDQGHWAKYYSGRRVSSDGGTLRAHAHHWYARALLAQTEAEAIGIFRMLDCGSDAGSLPGGERGAYGKLTKHGFDMVKAYGLVSELVMLDRSAAALRLKEAGLDEAQANSVLESTHCAPPEAFLAVDTLPINQAKNWTGLGMWRPGQPDVPGMGYAYPGSLPCAPSEGKWKCRIGAAFGQRQLFGFTFDRFDPPKSELHFVPAKGGPQRTQPPEGLFIAHNGSVERIPTSGPANGVGVLVDMDQQVIVVGGVELVGSMFTRLMFLRAEHAPRFERVDEYVDHMRRRVRTWRLRWE